ncbi:GTP cyclohydrolase II [Aestuariibius sp. 2305UL40-4]|uniref:GTP cyclohydrolase II n=1 Tax=Aestuariibius violaceus TaxID=3234132 RepID=UPI00345F03D9
MLSQSLMPNRTERVNRVRGDLAMGIPCLLTNGPDRALLVPLETVTEDRFAALRVAFGVPELVISASRARAVMTFAAAANLGAGPVRIRPPEAADFAWYQRVIDTKFDYRSGSVGPLHVLRAGETQLHQAGLGLIKSAELIPAFALFRLAKSSPTLADLPLMSLNAGEALEELADRPVLAPVASAQLPLEVHDASRLHVFRDPDGQREHYAIEIGSPDLTKPILTRLHSACFTGDVLGSLKCDCGPQLRAALARMSEEGAGLLVYLNQEGRGIGLANKMRVYDLQSKGLDTVEANHQLGFEDDERDFRLAAEVLHKLGITNIRLLTNNPSKERSLAESGITVTERLPLRVGQTVHNQGYLSIKALKSGHFL